jgi:WD40 repeat protein
VALKGHTGTVWSVAFSSDGKQVVTGSGDETATLWDVVSGQAVLTLKHATGFIVAGEAKTVTLGAD